MTLDRVPDSEAGLWQISASQIATAGEMLRGRQRPSI